MHVIKKILRKIPLIRNLRIKQSLIKKAGERGIRIRFHLTYADFNKERRTIRISADHLIYGADIIDSYDYYFSAVEPIEHFETSLVDYSTPRYHDVVGYDKHPIFFPSFAEPLVTTQQYIEFSNLKLGSIAIDLGAYSGLTSIIFKETVGPGGVVIAVDADKNNLLALDKNLSSYHKVTDNSIASLYGAVWIHNNGLAFSSEGNMGSSAADIVGNTRGRIDGVPSFTLLSIADKFDLDRVDFIKCDVEGAEAVIFEDANFFAKYKPRIIIETHMVGGKETTDKCMSDLKNYGYEFKRIHQTGVSLPLIECYPPLN